jgi:hypothetical protein
MVAVEAANGAIDNVDHGFDCAECLEVFGREEPAEFVLTDESVGLSVGTCAHHLPQNFLRLKQGVIYR